MHRRPLLLFCALTLLAQAAAAQSNRLFAIHNRSSNRFLATVDPSTGALTSVGPVPFSCDAIAFSPDGRLFAADNSSFQLVVLDPANATVDAVIGPFNDITSHVERMAFHPHTGVLYGLDSFNYKLLRIDTSTGQVTSVGSTGAPPTPAGLTWNLEGTKLYMCDFFDGCLYEVNPATGATTPRGCDDAQEPYGLATDGYTGIAYAVERQGNGASDAKLATVDLANGARTTVATMVGGPDIEDLTFGPGPGTKYCAANPNSTGDPASITASGSPSSAAGNLAMAATHVPNQPGVFFHGANPIQSAFGNGFLCAAGGVRRGTPVFASGQLALYVYDNSIAKRSLANHVGTTRRFQYWFRDPMGGGAAFNLSDGIAVPIAP